MTDFINTTVEFLGYFDDCKHCEYQDVSVLAIIKKGHRVKSTNMDRCETMTNSDLERCLESYDKIVLHITTCRCPDCVEYLTRKSKLESQLADAEIFRELKSKGGDGLGNTCVTVRQIFINHLESQIKELKEQLSICNDLGQAQQNELEQYKKVVDEIKESFDNNGICCVRCYGLPRKSLKVILSKLEEKK